jgi:OOP family OmpA-OmpF porin
MIAILRLSVLLALLLPASAALAGPPALELGEGAVLAGERSLALGSMDFPIAGFDGAKVPMRRAEGQLLQRAWRLEGSRAETLAIVQRLEAQLKGQGWSVVFSCETSGCGGFDFRYGMDVLPEPDMHVDLGDFRYLLAEDGKAGLASLLVSRSLDRGFVQLTAVTPGQAVAEERAEPMPSDANALAQSVATAPQPGATAPGGLAEDLAERGAAVLEDLVFASGKAELAEGEYGSLQALAEWLKANPGQRVTLVGHTDATGSLAANTALSRARAEAVRARLVDGLGADAARIEAQGAGYLAPRATNQTAEGRQRNRRVEVMVTSVAAD